jgi:RNA recognition motif-containing protein
MAKRLFVGGLSYDVTNNELEELFSQVGKIESISLVTDRYTGQSKGFAFVEMMTEEEAQAAIQKLNGYNLKGRNIVVNEARPREDRPRGSFGQGGGGGGGGRDFGRNDRRGGGGGFSRPKRW